MRITVRVQTKQIGIEVGEGQQNIKWLSQVVSARIVQSRLLRSTFEEEKRLVINMKSDSGAPLDPTATIADILSADAVVVAEVSEEIVSDAHGNPIISEWRREAFTHSVAGLNFARGVEAWKRNPSRMRTGTTAGGGAGDSLVFVGELSEADVFAALELDWPMLDWSWVFPDGSEDFMYRLKDAIKLNYGVVCRLFSFFAGLGRAGGRYGLTPSDFRHMLCCAGLFPISAQRKIETLFVTVAGAIEDNGPSRPATAASGEPIKWALMSRCEFMDALARLAIGDPAALQSRPLLENHVVSSISSLLSGPLLAYWRNIQEKMESYSNEYVRELLNKSEVYLKDIFENYGSVSKHGPVILQETLRDIIYGSDVTEERLAYDQILEDVFLRQCRVVMSPVSGYGNAVAAAVESGGHHGHTHVKGGSSGPPSSGRSSARGIDEFNELTYSEFREALVKAVKYALAKNDELSDNEKVQIGIERVASIAIRPHK